MVFSAYSSNLDALRGKSVRQLAAHVGLPMWKMPRVLAHCRQLMAAGIDRIDLFEGMREALCQLAGHGVTLALVSSNSEQNARAVLGPQAALFSHYACGASLFGKWRKLRRSAARPGAVHRRRNARLCCRAPGRAGFRRGGVGLCRPGRIARLRAGTVLSVGLRID